MIMLKKVTFLVQANEASNTNRSVTSRVVPTSNADVLYPGVFRVLEIIHCWRWITREAWRAIFKVLCRVLPASVTRSRRLTTTSFFCLPSSPPTMCNMPRPSLITVWHYFCVHQNFKESRGLALFVQSFTSSKSVKCSCSLPDPSKIKWVITVGSSTNSASWSWELLSE